MEEGKVNWKTVISNFYPDLDEAVKKAEKELQEVQILHSQYGGSSGWSGGGKGQLENSDFQLLPGSG